MKEPTKQKNLFFFFLKRIYMQDHISNGLFERTKKIVEGLNVAQVITDFKTERTYQTARNIALNAKLDHLSGVPLINETFANEYTDDVVATITIPKDKEEEVSKNRKQTEEQLRDVALKIGQDFLDNLGINYQFDKNTFQKLPDWMKNIAESKNTKKEKKKDYFLFVLILFFLFFSSQLLR